MGQGALIGVVAVTITMMMFMYTAQLTSRETQDVQNEAAANEAARDLAMQGRKLILAAWMKSSGSMNTAPFSSIVQDGGSFSVTSFDASSSTLDVTIRGEYDGAVHDIRSRYQWNSYGLNPLQIKAADLNVNIASNANLDFSNIAVDDQALAELDEVLIQDLGLGSDLSDFGLGMNDMTTELSSALNSSGNSDMSIEVIDAAQRSAMEKENGMFFPDQVKQMLSTYMSANPALVTTMNGSPSLPPSFGMDKSGQVMKVTGDLDISGSFSGQGILIVEGNLTVPAGSSFTWDGIVLVNPPSSYQNPKVDLSGTVNLNGGLIALHDAMPNSGHMDITSFRDLTGTWSFPQGIDRKLWYWRWCFYHRHDFTSKYGNSIRYYANSANDRIHEREHYLHETLKKFPASQEVFFELNNTATHGRGSLSIELKDTDLIFYPVSAGFDPIVANPGNAYRTRTFKINELKYLHLDINRLSSLKKMWDTKEKYPGCVSTSGPLCVGYDYNRMGSLTLSLYTVNNGAETKVYEVSMYWHRRTDEIEDFNKKMEDLITDLKSPNYGLDINMGADVTFTADDSALSMLGNMGGAPVGFVHLGTWHSHWDVNHPDNPLKQTP